MVERVVGRGGIASDSVVGFEELAQSQRQRVEMAELTRDVSRFAIGGGAEIFGDGGQARPGLGVGEAGGGGGEFPRHVPDAALQLLVQRIERDPLVRWPRRSIEREVLVGTGALDDPGAVGGVLSGARKHLGASVEKRDA